MSSLTVSAPTRIADLGGWTDTWFAAHGLVCNLAVWPGVDVCLTPTEGPAGVEVRLRNFDREWHWSPGTPAQVCPDPLIGACLDEAEVPEGAWLLEVGSRVPPGASMGTSASLCVALLVALDRLRARAAWDGGALPPAIDLSALVARAHRVETVRLGQQSGIQDQWAAAAGGISLIEMAHYPTGRRSEVRLAPATREGLQQGLLVMLLDRGHDSSAVHQQVVEALRHATPDDPRLEALRSCARDGARALRDGDLAAYGAALTRNTNAQAALHPALVSDDARVLIEAARESGAVLGWKVNGAGGEGGSVTLLARDASARTRLADRLVGACPGTQVLDVELAAEGVRLYPSPEVV